MTAAYKKLTDYIEKLDNIEFGEWEPKVQPGDGSLERPFRMPYVVYADVVNSFVLDVHEFCEEHPELGLNNYQAILKQNDIAWDEKEMKNADVSQMDVQSVAALILAAVRAERFCDGALLDFLEAGYIKKWLERLRVLENDN